MDRPFWILNIIQLMTFHEVNTRIDQPMGHNILLFSIVLFISIVIIGFATGFAIFKIYTEIPSLPVALLTLILSICFSTNEVSIDSNLVMFWDYLYTWMFLIYSTAIFSNVFSYINKKIIKCFSHLILIIYNSIVIC